MQEIVQELQKVDATLVVEDIPKTIMKTMVFEAEERKRIKLPKARSVMIGVGGLLALLLIGILGFWMTGTTKRTDDSKKLASLAIQSEKTELRIGEKTLLRTAGKFADGSDAGEVRNVDWRSSNEAVIKVSSKGEAEGRQDGVADVTVIYQGMTSAPLTLIVIGDVARIEEHIKNARTLLDQGNYSGALKVLYEAKTLDPKNKDLEAEIDRARKACLAEQRIGLTKSRCD